MIKFPLARDDAVRLLTPYLWEYEKKEILEYDVIYFFPISDRLKN